MVPRYLQTYRKTVDYEAVELSVSVSESLRNLGYIVHTGSIYADRVASVVAGKFDCVIATEVIEHDLHPSRFVAGLFNALRVGGAVCLTTGNFDSVMARFKGPGWYYLDPPAHVSFYTPRSIKKLFYDIGFRQVRIDCIGSTYLKFHANFPLPGFLWLIDRLQIPTGMTICATK